MERKGNVIEDNPSDLNVSNKLSHTHLMLTSAKLYTFLYTLCDRLPQQQNLPADAADGESPKLWCQTEKIMSVAKSLLYKSKCVKLQQCTLKCKDVKKPSEVKIVDAEYCITMMWLKAWPASLCRTHYAAVLLGCSGHTTPPPHMHSRLP